MSWLTVYDEFYGAMEHTQGRELQIPFGPRAWEYDQSPTMRRGGDWCACRLARWTTPVAAR